MFRRMRRSERGKPGSLHNLFVGSALRNRIAHQHISPRESRNAAGRIDRPLAPVFEFCRHDTFTPSIAAAVFSVAARIFSLTAVSALTAWTVLSAFLP